MTKRRHGIGFVRDEAVQKARFPKLAACGHSTGGACKSQLGARARLPPAHSVQHLIAPCTQTYVELENFHKIKTCSFFSINNLLQALLKRLQAPARALHCPAPCSVTASPPLLLPIHFSLLLSAAEALRNS